MVTAVAAVFLVICSSSYTAASSKKGVAVWPDNYRCDDLAAFEDISWWHNFGMKLPDAIDGRCRNRLPTQEHVSMLPTTQGTEHVGNRLPEGTRYLMGFDEPNHNGIRPELAARKWTEIEASLSEANRSDVYLVSPSASWCETNCTEQDPFIWFDEFFGNCSDCRIDALATTDRSCNSTALMDYIDALYDRYNKTIWLTYSCQPDSTNYYLRDIYPFMLDTLDFLEATDKVGKYCWNATRFSEDVSYPQRWNQLLHDDYSILSVRGRYWDGIYDYYNS